MADINSQLIGALKDYHKTAVSEMAARLKIEKEMVYKNIVRHIYNNYLSGGI